MISRLLTLSLIIIVLQSGRVFADGGPVLTKDFHFISGKRATLMLSANQIAELESQRKGKAVLGSAKLTLTEKQTQDVYAKTNRTVTELKVFEGVWTGCGCCAKSSASRYKPDRVEVSSDYLMDTAELKRWDDFAKATQLRQQRSRKHWWQFWREKL